MNRWINLLALLPGTSLTLLVISIAFLRFYDKTDFLLLGQLANPRLWSNRLTVAALVVALVNLGVEWNRRNRETDRLARAEAEKVEEEQRRVEESEQAARRARVKVERDLALLTFLADPSERNRQILTQIVMVLSEYRDSL
ncbi:MAG: hypothetical protein HC879_06720 [Leptolyngbyaceae cyanobacterium SL_5_9]|nr:hypothetical protein [Leptolyngbyaceae cyanobacterium SL_5_9]NJO73392.1 hypothetical protein [Leptolyngbyaceae cyanobacterium RM1_406_9]